MIFAPPDGEVVLLDSGNGNSVDPIRRARWLSLGGSDLGNGGAVQVGGALRGYREGFRE